jgi:hypothetical protein
LQPGECGTHRVADVTASCTKKRHEDGQAACTYERGARGVTVLRQPVDGAHQYCNRVRLQACITQQRHHRHAEVGISIQKFANSSFFQAEPGDVSGSSSCSCVVDGNSSLHNAQQRLQATSSQHRRSRSRAYARELPKRSQPRRRSVWCRVRPKQRRDHTSRNKSAARAGVVGLAPPSGSQRTYLHYCSLARRRIRASERLHERCDARR